METAAEPDELVRAVILPAQPEGARTAYMKFSIRPLDFAIVGVAVRVVTVDDGTITDARIGLNGAANHCLRATDAEARAARRRAVGRAVPARRRRRPRRSRIRSPTSTATRTTSATSSASTPARALEKAMGVIDFNADLGESFGLWERGADEALMRVISSANVACGFHAGDPGAMRRAVAQARAQRRARSAPIPGSRTCSGSGAG